MGAPGGGGGAASTRSIGVLLLMIVNVLWVLSAELTRFIFIDEGFRRPFFTWYVKMATLLVYMLKYCVCGGEVMGAGAGGAGRDDVKFRRLSETGSDITMDDLDRLSVEGFETMTDTEDERAAGRDSRLSVLESLGGDTTLDGPVPAAGRSVRFAHKKEVRRMPSSQADAARLARLSHDRSLPLQLQVECTPPPYLLETAFFYAPMWLVCSLTYQCSLLFSTVSTVNLLSSCSSVFVLAFGLCCPGEGERFSVLKLFVVLMNVLGVWAVSSVSGEGVGAALALGSALAYAIYLTAIARASRRGVVIDLTFMFGMIGVLSVVAGTPMLFILDGLGWERLHPMPDRWQLATVLASALVGTAVADYIWLKAALLTSSLLASLSLTLMIPLSFLTDALVRHEPISSGELLASIPIVVSFVAAAYLDNQPVSKSRTGRATEVNVDGERLLSSDEDEL